MSDFLPQLYGLLSAATWGAGDFSGGIASKRSNTYGVVIVSQAIGLIMLIVGALLLGEPIPSARSLLIGGIGGILGAGGLLALYRGLATGRMGMVAPISAVVGVLIPMIIGTLTQGVAEPLQLVGFALSLLAVWLVSKPEGGTLTLRDLTLPVIAGVGFGTFFVVINQATLAASIDQVVVLWPLAAARMASISLLLVLVTLIKQQWRPAAGSLGVIAAAGILDALGNAFYALAAHMGRLDEASVLSSLYPAMTVLLAWLLLKERLGRQQMVGLFITIISIIFITV
ncbi:MAG: EamA family transporter [Anaerolineae bacterium]|nr:EamA family transporter [Anaerolineae bacterium]